MSEATFTIILITVEIIFSLFVLRAMHEAGARKNMIMGFGAIFVVWLASLTIAISNGQFSATGYPLVAFVMAIAIPVIIGVCLNRYWSPFSNIIKNLSQITILKLQWWRAAFGILFFFAAGIPQWFQALGGGGDIAAGITAFLATLSLKKNKENERAKVIAGNSVGILDFLIVLNIGVFVVLKNESPDMIFNLIPLYVVPIFILLHIFSLEKLRKGVSV